MLDMNRLIALVPCVGRKPHSEQVVVLPPYPGYLKQNLCISEQLSPSGSQLQTVSSAAQGLHTKEQLQATRGFRRMNISRVYVNNAIPAILKLIQSRDFICRSYLQCGIEKKKYN